MVTELFQRRFKLDHLDASTRMEVKRAIEDTYHIYEQHTYHSLTSTIYLCLNFSYSNYLLYHVYSLLQNIVSDGNLMVLYYSPKKLYVPYDKLNLKYFLIWVANLREPLLDIFSRLTIHSFIFARLADCFPHWTAAWTRPRDRNIEQQQ